MTMQPAETKPPRTTIDWPRFVSVIRSHERFVLTSHIRPDCDALGSELGMAGILDALGKQVRIVNAHATPPNLRFIDPTNRLLLLGKDISVEEAADTDVLMILDTSAWAQLGDMGQVIRATKAKKIIVDHHVSEDDLGAEPFKNTLCEATGRLVYEAAEELGVSVTPEIATPLFAAVATDTGWFRFASTKSSTYHLAAELMDCGAKPDAIYNSLYEQTTLARLRLIGLCMARTITEKDGKLVHTAILKSDFENTGALPSDTEDLVNMTLAVAGTRVAIILVEQATGGFKVSFRSRGIVDCSRLAEQFGGGGHKAAAGAFVPGAFEEAQKRVLDAARAALG